MGEGDALGEMMRVFQKPLDRKHPLWALHVFYNLDGNRTALMWKVHHCLVDGVSGVELLKVMYDFRAEPDDIPQPPEPWVAAKPSSLIRRMADAVRESDSRRGERDDRRCGRGDRGSGVGGGACAAVGRGVAGDDGAGDAANRADAVEFDAGDAGPGGNMDAADVRGLSRNQDGVRRLGQRCRTGYVDRGAARYLEHHGYAVEGQQLCIGCPVNVRHRDERSSLGNRVSMMFPTAPAAPMDIVERLKLIHEETERIKAAGSAQALEAMMGLGDTIPPSLIGPASRVATTMLDVGGRLAKVDRLEAAAGRLRAAGVRDKFYCDQRAGRAGAAIY